MTGKGNGPDWRDCAGHDGDVAATARALVADGAALVDERIEALVGDAVRRWRLDDAIFWQRVRFRATCLTGARRTAPSC